MYSHEQLFESILLRSFQAPSAPYISHLRVVPASLIAEHPSLSLQSGIVACCNCLKAIRECSPESRAPNVPLLECAEPSNEHAGPNNEHVTPLCSERDGCSAINDAGTTRRCEYIWRRWCLKGSQQYRLQ